MRQAVLVPHGIDMETGAPRGAERVEGVDGGKEASSPTTCRLTGPSCPHVGSCGSLPPPPPSRKLCHLHAPPLGERCSGMNGSGMQAAAGINELMCAVLALNE